MPARVSLDREHQTLGPGLGVEQRLGEGAMGDVYQVVDGRTGERLAVKVLRRVDRRRLLDFKNEFRALAGLRNPHLVRYVNLLLHDGDWCLVMELVDGSDLSTMLPDPAAGSAMTLPAEQLEVADGVATLPDSLPLTAAHPLPESALLQRIARGLVDGLSALHAAGFVHRDLKPSNVRLRPSGEVVILDMGLVAPVGGDDAVIVGTPRYMAPEALDPPVGPAADWYAVGLMLFELMTGRLPFEGKGLQRVRQRAARAAPRVRDVVPGAPRELAALTDALLAVDPAERPDDDAARAAVGLPPLGIGEPSLPFVGREAPLATLTSAFASACDGRPTLVRVSAPSGLGKTALLRAFLPRVDDSAVVLSGRCHAEETLPYKALDGVVDAMSVWLSRRAWRPTVADGLEAALVAAFPVLEGVLLSEPAPPDGAAGDPALALREVVVQLAARRPVVLVVDDVQWADADSAVLLRALLADAAPLRVLVVLAHRPGAEADAFVSGLGRAASHHIELAPFVREEADALVRALPDDTVMGDAWRESSGHPYLFGELLRSTGPRAGVGLDDLLTSRLAALDRAPRVLVEVVAVAGGLVPDRVLERALMGGVDDAAPHRLRLDAADCRALRLLRVSTTRDGMRVDVYHDRVRQVALVGLPAARRTTIHAALARSWEAERGVDPTVVARHWEGAGEAARARAAWLSAVDRAEQAQAYGLAADLLAKLVDGARADERDVLRSRQVVALGRAGRRAEAADLLLQLAETQSGLAANRDRRRAAEHLMRSGRFDEGIELFRRVARAAGLPWSRSRAVTIGRIAVSRTALAVRGYDPAPRRRPLSAEEIARIDLCGALNRGLRFAAPLEGMTFGAWFVQGALKIGEPGRVARALGMECGTLAVKGSERPAAADALVARVAGLLDEIDDPFVRAVVRIDLGGAAYLAGEFEAARRRIDTGAAELATLGDRAAAEADLVWAYRGQTLFVLGAVVDLARQGRAALADAIRRGDRWTELWLRGGVLGAARVLCGEPLARVRADVEAAGADAALQAVPLLAVNQLLGHAELLVMGGEGRAALARLESSWSLVKDAFLLETQVSRGTVWHLRARAALSAMAEGDASAARSLATAQAALGKESAPWIRAAAALVEAGRASLAGDRAGRVHALDSAAVYVEEAGLVPLADVVAEARTGRPHPRDGVDRAFRFACLAPGLEDPCRPSRARSSTTSPKAS